MASELKTNLITPASSTSITIGGSGDTVSLGSGATASGFSTAGADTSLSNLSATGESKVCQAWVNFTGTGTISINGSVNVSSLTDNGTGNYTVNFATAMQDANYCSVSTVERTGSYNWMSTIGSHTSSSIVIRASSTSGTLIDGNFIYLSVFR